MVRVGSHSENFPSVAKMASTVYERETRAGASRPVQQTIVYKLVFTNTSLRVHVLEVVIPSLTHLTVAVFHVFQTIGDLKSKALKAQSHCRQVQGIMHEKIRFLCWVPEGDRNVATDITLITLFFYYFHYFFSFFFRRRLSFACG